MTVKDISKDFGGVRALHKVNLSVERGMITGLIGPNGAGKTTLFNIIAGVYGQTEGSVFLEGKCIDGMPTHRRVEMGITRTFQLTRPFKKMSVIENVMVGAHSWTRSGRNILHVIVNSPLKRKEEIRICESAMETLKFVGIEKVARDLAANLPHGQQRLLEIARAITTKAKVVLLDEPAAGLNPHEVDLLKETLRTIVTKRETTIFLVEHDMRLVMSICDRVYVLDLGMNIAEGTPEEIGRNKRVIEAYLGREY